MQRDLVALAHHQTRDLAKLAEAIAQSIYLVAAGDRHQVRAIGAVGLVSAVDRGAPVWRAADHRRRQDPADIAVRDQILYVINCRRSLALQSDRVADAFAVRRFEHLDSLRGVTAERPFAI